MRAILFAAALLFAAACGDDPAGPSTETGAATVSVDLTNEPDTQVTLVFHRPNGSVLERVDVNKGGVTTAQIQNGGMLTVVRARDNEYALETLTGLRIGTIKSRLHRGLAALRRELGHDE